MKPHLTLILILCNFSIFAQSEKSIELIQGQWQFKKMIIEGDTSFKTDNFHATTLTVEKNDFILGLSEAYAGGQLVSKGDEVEGIFKVGDQVFDQLYFEQVNKNSLVLRLTTSTPEYWTGTPNQQIIIYLKYKRMKK